MKLKQLPGLSVLVLAFVAVTIIVNGRSASALSPAIMSGPHATGFLYGRKLAVLECVVDPNEKENARS